MKFKTKKRLLIDMTASVLHHGHIRLIKKAKKLGNVEIIIGLTKDDEVKKYKGFYPEIKYSFRKEILESIKYVDKVIPSKWNIDDKFLNYSENYFYNNWSKVEIHLLCLNKDLGVITIRGFLKSLCICLLKT